jgi:hypothetical protein
MWANAPIWMQTTRRGAKHPVIQQEQDGELNTSQLWQVVSLL